MGGNLWDEINDGCHELSGEVGAVTGAAYALGAERFTGSPVVAAGVGQVIKDTVSENWGHVCDLPENLGLVASDPGHLDWDDGATGTEADYYSHDSAAGF